MLRFFSLSISIFLLSSGLAFGGDVGIKGSVAVNDQGHAILSLKLINDSETAICFEDWFPSRSEIVSGEFVDSFILKDAEGNDVETLQPRIIRDVGPATLNRRVYMLRKGEDAEALIDLSSWYKLDYGSYTVSYLLSTLPCGAYAKADSYLTSSRNLKGLTTYDSLSVIKVLTRASKYEDLVFLDPLRFKIPNKSDKREE